MRSCMTWKYATCDAWETVINLVSKPLWETIFALRPYDVLKILTWHISRVMTSRKFMTTSWKCGTTGASSFWKRYPYSRRFQSTTCKKWLACSSGTTSFETSLSFTRPLLVTIAFTTWKRLTKQTITHFPIFNLSAVKGGGRWSDTCI